MRICPVSYNFNSPVLREKNICKKNEEHKKENLQMPSCSQVLAFCGGRSLNLQETYNSLKAMENETGKKVFPDGVEDMILETLNNGNPENKTLIDIHKERYEGLYSLDTLDDIKFFYPEFSDVLSDSKTDYVKNSFIDDVKKGKIEAFNPKDDLAIQLLQLYWAEGFSLNDLKSKTGGKDINYAYNKLNIPKLNPVYAQYLKLSDKEYNARLTCEMSSRMTGIARKKAETREGVYIPRGPLSEEHKRKISEGLIRYYAEHPEKLTEMSAKKKEFYEKSPLELEKLKTVMSRAWDYKECDSLKKRLAKFLSKPHATNEELTEFCLQNEKMQEFWKRNPWAKEKLSAAMKKSWERQRYLTLYGIIHEPDFMVRTSPIGADNNLCNYILSNYPNLSEEEIYTIKNLHNVYMQVKEAEISPIVTQMQALGSKYYAEHPEQSALVADTYHFTLIKGCTELLNQKGNRPEDKKLALKLALMLTDFMNGKEKHQARELSIFYFKLIRECCDAQNRRFVQILTRQMDELYDTLQTMSYEDKMRLSKSCCIKFAETRDKCARQQFNP